MNYITLQDSYQFREDYAIINKIKRVSGLSEIRNAVPQFLKLVDEAINKVGGEKYMIVLLKIGLALYGVIYAVLKRLPVQKKIVFMSRQSNEPSLDIRMTADEIKKSHPDYKTVILCRKIEKNLKGMAGYGLHMFRQLYHMATAEAAVLDSYCIPACCLHHRKGFLIVQMWHSIGTMKKFGYSILDQPEGTSRKMAEAMHMHDQYDFVFASGDYKPHLAEGFNQDIDKIVTFPLPRVELLKRQDYAESIKRKILADYPQLADPDKKNVVYCPTFRKESSEFVSQIDAVEELVAAIDTEKYNLILKLHPLSEVEVDSPGVLCDHTYSTMDMLFVSDYVVSDYSCIIYEAAILNRPVYLFAYDFEQYTATRDFYIDYRAEVPGPVCADAAEVAASVGQPYNMEKLAAFRDRYISPLSHNETKSIVDFIFEQIEKKTEADHE